MFTFFRKTRQQFISGRNTGRYLLYAIGEVFLVVVGILIALQVDNWNEENKKQRKVQQYLIALKDEFKQNQKFIEEAILTNQENIEATIDFLNLMNKKQKEIGEEELSKKLLKVISSDAVFQVNASVLEEMFNGGVFKDIQNEQLKQELSVWKSTVKSIQNQEGIVQDYRKSITDMIQSQGSIRTIFRDIGFSKAMELQESKHPVSNIELLSSLELENMLLLFLGTSSPLKSSFYQPAKEDVKEILKMIEQEIK